MARWRAALARLWGWGRLRARDADMDDEFEAHLLLAADDYERRGLSPADARRQAERDFGSRLAARDAHRDQRGVPALESCVQDVGLALRRLRHQPFFSLVAITTLALGIGVNTAVFSMLHATLLRSLPVPAPEQLVGLSAINASGDDDTSFSYPMFDDLRRTARPFTHLTAIAGVPVNVAVDGATEQVRGELVSGNYYAMLGVTAAAGRLLTEADDRVPGAHPVVVVSHGFWQRRLGASAAAIGSTIVVNGRAMTVVGVSPAGFAGMEPGRRVDLRFPMMMATALRPFPANRLENRQQQWLRIVARLRADTARAAAEAELAPLFAHLRQADLGDRAATMSDGALERFRAWRLALTPAQRGLGRAAREMGQPLRVLQGVALLILLLACTNVANMLLARNAARQREVAIRAALGAGRRRLVRQWLTESLLLALLGAGAGLPLAWIVPSLLRAFAPADATELFDTPVNLAVLGVTLAAATLTGLLAGLAPALQLTRERPPTQLRSDAPSLAGGDRPWSLRGGLVLAQVALSVPLVGAGILLVQSLRHLDDIDPGVAAREVLVAQLTPSLNGYPQDRLRQFYDRVLASARALPGVTCVSLASDSMLSGGWDRYGVGVEGHQPRDGEDISPNALMVSPGYFGTLGMPLVAGRDFSDRDVNGSPRVAIINERMARYYFGAANPLGKRITLDPGPRQVLDIEIVGVARDVKYVDLREDTPRHLYLPLAQQPRVFDLTLHVRTERDPAALVVAVRDAVAAIDRQVPVAAATPLATQIAATLVRERLVAWLAGIGGVLALALSAVGLAGVVGYTVARRTHEIGVRLALGARGRDVVRLILRQVTVLVAAGAVAGTAMAAAGVGWLAGLLYGVGRGETVAGFAIGLGILGATAALACWIPARRAAQVEPIVALRVD